MPPATPVRVQVRFFTLEWWCGLQSGDLSNNPADEYRSYLETIRDRLPPGLLALQESVSLHDGRLRELELSPSTGTLSLIIDSDDGSGGLRRHVLRYRSVTSFRSFADPDVGLAGPHGYGDWGYDEAAVTEAGEIVHRILFSSGVEFEVKFGDFELL